MSDPDWPLRDGEEFDSEIYPGVWIRFKVEVQTVDGYCEDGGDAVTTPILALSYRAFILILVKKYPHIWGVGCLAGAITAMIAAMTVGDPWWPLAVITTTVLWLLVVVAAYLMHRNDKKEQDEAKYGKDVPTDEF